jgi:hypothetical protein
MHNKQRLLLTYELLSLFHKRLIVLLETQPYALLFQKVQVI